MTTSALWNFTQKSSEMLQKPPKYAQGERIKNLSTDRHRGKAFSVGA
jgi:hypothetical protein